MRNPEDKSPEPPGGRAAERLREFKKQRIPQDQPAEEDPDSGNPSDKTYEAPQSPEENDQKQE